LDPVAAAKSGLGFRYIENTLTKAAIDAQLHPEPTIPQQLDLPSEDRA
jgi:hypothetical protein